MLRYVLCGVALSVSFCFVIACVVVWWLWYVFVVILFCLCVWFVCSVLCVVVWFVLLFCFVYGSVLWL